MYVSNPISGEVGAAVQEVQEWLLFEQEFQTPSAGRWVLQQRASAYRPSSSIAVSNPISGEVGAAAQVAAKAQHDQLRLVSNPISGEVGAAAYKGMFIIMPAG